MRKLLKPLAILLVIANLLLTPFPTFAASGTSGASAEDSALLKKWKQLGLLDNGVNVSELYKPIQKIDFIGFVNDVLKPSKQADINFIDVPKDSWYGKEIAKAVAAGYVVNDGKKNFQPFSYITRVEAAVMVAKVFGLELSDQKLLKKITDAEKLDSEQLQAFGAVIEKGYLSEISSGRYAPLGVLKLIDAMKMLDKCIGLVITKSGTVTKNVTGNMIINTSSVNLKNMEISGDLIIGEGVADGNVTLENVTIKGKLVIRGGGQNGVIIKSSSIKGDVIVEKYAGNIYVVAQGTTTIENTHLKSGGTLLETNLNTGKGFVNVIAEQAVAANQIANLEGDFDSIQTAKSNINIRLKGKAKNVNILEGTISGFTLVSGSADTIDTKATKSTIQLLGGIVNTLNVEKNATGNRIDLNGVAKVDRMNIYDTTSINFEKGNVDTLIIDASSGNTYLSMKENAYIKNIVANAAATITGTGNIENMYVYADGVKVEITPKSVYIANGVASDVNGTIIDTTKPTVGFSVPDQIGMMVKDTKQINVSGLSPSKTRLTYISSDNTIATVSDDGVITGVSIGTTKIYVTGQYSNFNSKTATINVTVASDNVTNPGTLEINPESGEAGTKADFVLTYTAGDNMSNGTVVIKLPIGFMALESDTVSIDGSEEKALTASQRPNSQTLSFTNLDLQENTGKIVIKLKNKVIPNEGEYTFTAIADADGAGPTLATLGNEKAVFTVDSLRKLKENINYWTPTEGSKGGTIKIPKLSTAGIITNTDLKWMIKVQDDEFTSVPKFNDVISASEYTEYKQGQDIAVTAGQKMRLIVVDRDSNEIKAYVDLTIDGSWIRQYDAGELKLDTNYSSPEQGVKAGTVRITGLKFTDLDPSADSWMIKVENTKPETIFIDANLGDTAVSYVDGDDISAYEGQYIILAAVDSDKKVKAYTAIKVTSDMISKKAGELQPEGNYSLPTYGTDEGTTQITALNIGSFDISKWLYVVLDKNDVITIPALNASVNDYTKYLGKDSTENDRSFTEYKGGNISAVDGQHMLLVGVNASDEIQAYADIALNSSNIRNASAPKIPSENIGALEIGSKQGTTKILSLKLDDITDATKFMIKVQNEELINPQKDRELSGASDYTAPNDIKVADGQFIVIVATDDKGKVKAYENIKVTSDKIRPADALKLKNPDDYECVAGSEIGSTQLTFKATGYQGWRYIISNTALDVPYQGSKISGTIVPASNTITINDVSVNQHILILAVNSDGETLAYADEILNTNEIRQPLAGVLNSDADVAVGYNYSTPEPGDKGGQTKIASLSYWDIAGATKWLYKMSSVAITAPEYNNSNITGLKHYTANLSINATEGEYLLLFAVDDSNRIKKYACIKIEAKNISIPELTSPANYSALEQGTTPGTTRISLLSFVGLVGYNNTTWKWRYSVGNTKFANQAKGAIVDTTTTKLLNDGGTITDIEVNANQYILLLAVDANGVIQGYANILVNSSNIRPTNADEISAYSLEKGSKEGTTRFSNLEFTGIVGATKWMYKVQKDVFATPIGKDTIVSDAKVYNYSDSSKPDIAIEADWHILLLATDVSGKVKAYKDITVNKTLIQNPFAMELKLNENYTKPTKGTDEGTTKVTLKDTNIPKKATDVLKWKYKIGSQKFDVPHLDDDASGYIDYNSGANILAQPYNYLLIVATIDNKIQAYVQLTIYPDNILPKEAPLLEEGINNNYTLPVAGSKPGTTKIGYLSPIGVSGLNNGYKWVIKVVNAEEILALDSKFNEAVDYEQGEDITIQLGQFILLVAVDNDYKVKAYKNIKITDAAQLNPALAPAFNPLNNNYSSPAYGTKVGTTCLTVSLNGINGATGFVAKVVNAETDIIAGQKITIGTGTGTDYSDYREYLSKADIAISPNQYILLIAVKSDANGDVTAVAYANIQVQENQIRPGDAVELKLTDNYSKLQPGTDVGTTKFTYLSNVGVPGFDGAKWIVKITDSSILSTIPALNSPVDAQNAFAYTVQSNIVVKEGQYIALYAVDSKNAIKGYAYIKVEAGDVKGVAPDLDIKSDPIPGTILNTTTIAATEVTMPSDATVLKYKVQNSSAGVVLKDDKLEGLTEYNFGDNITAVENQYLLFVATDSNGQAKAFKEILVTKDMVRNVEITLSGTAVSMPTGEEHIVTGGRTVIIKLAYGVWQDDVLTNDTKRNALFDSFVATGNEQTQWNKVLTILKSEGKVAAVMNAAKDTITITLSETPAYNITDSQEITFTVKPEAGLIKGATKAATSINNIKIAAEVVAQISGTAVPSLGEGDIVAGNKEIIITLTNGKFALDVASDEDKRNAIFDGLITSSSDTTMWNKVITALKAAGETSIIRNSSSKITIKLPAVADYDISMNEIISVIVPYKTAGGGEILVDAIKNAPIATKITVAANSTATLSGTLISTPVSEMDILTGGKTLTITLSDGQWATDIKTNETKRNALFSGLVASTEATVWAKVVTALKAAGQTAIERTDNFTVTITLPAVAGYNITANQYVTMTIPATCMIDGIANLTIGGTISVGVVATAKLSGTAITSTFDEAAVRVGGKTIVITLNGATWVSDVATNISIKNALLAGFEADGDESAQWDAVISKASVARTSDTVATITLPASDYDITETQNITLTIPTSAAIGTSFEIKTENSFSIGATPPTSTKITGVNAPTGTYKQGDIILINVVFQDAVDVIFSATNAPYIELETGTIDRTAVYDSGTGTNTLTFKYVVQEGDSSQKLNYIKPASLIAPPGTAIKNKGLDVPADLALPTATAANSLSAYNICVDGVAPKFATNYPKADTKTETTANVKVKLDDEATVYYAVVLDDGTAITPTAEQVINWITTPDASVIAADTYSVDKDVEDTLSITGLSAYTKYKVYMVTQDIIGNRSSLVTTCNIQTADLTAPTLVAAQVTPTSNNIIDITVNSSENGKVYLIALPSGSTAPTSEQVKAFKDANGKTDTIPANLKTSKSVTANTDTTIRFTGLEVSTHYDIYVVCEDTSLNLIASPVLVNAETSKLTFDGVGVDLAKSILTNTINQMEYSFDGIVWTLCSNGNTNITYDDTAPMLTIYLREADDITNTMTSPFVLYRRNVSDIITNKIDYNIADGTITYAPDGTDPVANLQYRINGGAWAALDANTTVKGVIFKAGLLEVRTAATESQLPSAVVSIVNIPQPMPAPELIYDDDTNKIIGLLNTHEYRINGGSWINGIIAGDFAGTKTVQVREKATKTKLPSLIQEIKFTAGTLVAVYHPANTDDVLNKNYITIKFEENTNQAGKTLTVANIKDMFLVGRTVDGVYEQHNWGTDFKASFNSTGNVLTIVYDSMAGYTVKYGDVVQVNPNATIKIKDALGTSQSYSSVGTLIGNVPVIESIKAENTNNDIGFKDGERLVITFDQETNAPDATTITAANIGNYLLLTDDKGSASGKTWGTDIVVEWVDYKDPANAGTDADTPLVDKVQNNRILTITFRDADSAKFSVGDKIEVLPAWGLTAAEGSKAVCNSSAIIGGSFTTTPIVSSVEINQANPTKVNVGDKVIITFDQATNKTQETSTVQQRATWLNNYFKLSSGHVWGYQSDIQWSADGKQLIITLTSGQDQGATLKAGDTLTILSTAGIMAEGGGTAACTGSNVIVKK